MPRNEDIFEAFLDDIPGVKEINDDNIEPLEEVNLIWLDIIIKVIKLMKNITCTYFILCYVFSYIKNLMSFR